MPEDIQTYLLANGQTNVEIGIMPDSPAEVIGLFQYPGQGGEQVHNRPGVSRERPSIQIQVRAADHRTAQLRSYVVRDLLMVGMMNYQAPNPFYDSGAAAYYQGFEPFGDIGFLRRDQRGWVVFSQNLYASFNL